METVATGFGFEIIAGSVECEGIASTADEEVVGKLGLKFVVPKGVGT